MVETKNHQLEVEVAYARAAQQAYIITVFVPPASTIDDVIEKSGIKKLYPEIDLEKNKVGIFGKIRKLNFPVRSGDRVEIYRPLLTDPKEARRRRAKQ